MAKKTRSLKEALLIVFVGIACMMLFALIFVCIDVSYVKQMKWLKANGITVEAKIERLAYDSVGRGAGFWLVEYRYVDKNGIEYTGDCGWAFKTRQEAEAHIGNTIKIFIDGKGNSISSAKPINIKMRIIMVIVFSVVLCGCTVASSILSVKVVKEKKLKKQQHPNKNKSKPV